MSKILFVISAILSMSIMSCAHSHINIALAKSSKEELRSRTQLERLLRAHNVTRWIFTKTILIDETSTPHSHPVLTLHTRHLRDDDLFLSTFVHEQLHWFLEQKEKETGEAITELRVLFPQVPTGFPEGAETEASTYLHILVNYLEYRADKELLGELRAKQVMDFWLTDHYRWIYKLVLEHTREIKNIAVKHGLIPKSPP